MKSTEDKNKFSRHMQETVDSFISRVNALSGNLPVHIHIALDLYSHVSDRFQDFLDLHCKVAQAAVPGLAIGDATPAISSGDDLAPPVGQPSLITAVPGTTGSPSAALVDGATSEISSEYLVPIDKVQTFRVFRDELDRLDVVCKSMPELALIALVSQFDVFLASLIRGMLLVRPDIINASERSITYADLSRFGSLEEAREFFADKTIEGVLRQSHTEQFAWLEEKLKFTLRKGLDVWPDFVEISQRRNLFVHTDGLVTAQYIDECSRSSVVLESEVRRGTQLSVSPGYIATARNVALEVGIKLGYVIWKSLAPTPDDDEIADNYLNDVAVDLIQRKNFDLAMRLLMFPQEKTKPKFSNQLYLTLFCVNRALVLSRQGKQKDADAIVTSIEWRMLSENFQMAKLVLQKDFEGAAALMRRLGPESHVVSELNYLQWPILEEFRKTEQFRSAFRDVFGRDFTEFNPQEFAKSVYASLRNATQRKVKVPEKTSREDAICEDVAEADSSSTIGLTPET